MVYLMAFDVRKPLYQQLADGVAFFVSGCGLIRNIQSEKQLQVDAKQLFTHS